MNGLEEGIAARNAVLATFDTGEERRALLELLRGEAEKVARQRADRTASVNDIRWVLDEFGYDGDPRILGSVFHPSQWTKAGELLTDSPRAHARPIRLFRLAGSAE